MRVIEDAFVMFLGAWLTHVIFFVILVGAFAIFGSFHGVILAAAGYITGMFGANLLMAYSQR